jgi:hypothetical protein
MLLIYHVYIIVQYAFGYRSLHACMGWGYAPPPPPLGSRFKMTEAAVTLSLLVIYHVHLIEKYGKATVWSSNSTAGLWGLSSSRRGVREGSSRGFEGGVHTHRFRPGLSK